MKQLPHHDAKACRRHDNEGKFALQPLAQAIVLSLMLMQTSAHAAQLSLASAPQGRGGREPAPNIILSVDDSGSMGSTGINALKAALNNAFSASAVADDSIRLGFQAMWRCRGLQATPFKNNNNWTCPDTRIRYFSGTHRTNFNTWVNSLSAESGTPSHSMMVNVHKYMQGAPTAGIWSPFAAQPGVAETPVLTCRKTYHIFMTDGGWKDTNNHKGESTDSKQMGIPGNADGTSITLPDGTLYDPYGTTDAYTRIYRDSYAPVIDDLNSGTPRSAATRGTVSTLADWAFLMWSTDYMPSLANELRPIIRVPGSENYGSSGSTYNIPQYWNPKNNPMTWQGVTTYTIGFNAAANMNTNRITWNQYDDAAHAAMQVTIPKWGGDTWSGDVAAMIRGDVVNPPLQWANPLRGHPLSNGENDTSLQADYAQNSNGGGTARDKVDELWHMAINGRGKFIPASSAAQLSAAFAEIVNQIIQDSNAPITSISASTQSGRSDTKVFIGEYNSTNWNGALKAYPLTSTGTVSPTVSWNAASKLDAVTDLTARKILTQKDAAGTSLAQGISFEWSNLNTAQQADLQGTDTATIAQERLDYLRGDRTKEQSAGGTYRNRASRLGDIVNSVPWFIGKPNMGYQVQDYQDFRTNKSSRTPMVYIGANDGMLHGFAAETGDEKIAYIPRGLFPTLKNLTQTSYAHRYYVDGRPFSGDFKLGTTWKTALVGTLAGGGKGFFVLDVTSPEGFATATATTIANLVITDKTATFTASNAVGLPAATWNDIGHMYSAPTQDSGNPARVVQITKLNNNRWALLLGNGVNSTDETAVLLIQYLDGDKELVKLTADATTGAGNGLSHPQVIDLNGDDKADVAYAGDIKGNLWKFDLTSSDPANWSVAFSGQPLFVARRPPSGGTETADDRRQPITTAPSWLNNRVTSGSTSVNGLSLIFATGRDMTATDPADTSLQTLYSVWDNTNAAYTFNYTSGSSQVTLSGGSIVPDSTSGGRTSLAQVSQSNTIHTTTKGEYMSTTDPTLSYTGTGSKRGWYFDLPATRERGLANSTVLHKRMVAIPTIKPTLGSATASTAEACVPNVELATNYITVLNGINGQPYKQSPLFDTSGDGNFNSSDVSNASRVNTGSDVMIIQSQKTNVDFKSDFKLISASPTKTSGTTNAADGTNMRMSDIPARIGWRQLQ